MNDEWRKRLTELVARGQERCADPAFQAHAQRIAKEQEDVALIARRSLRASRGIPRTFWSVLDAPEETEALAAVKAFLASDKHVLVLSGDVGRGKSVAGAHGVDQVGGQFLDAADLVSMSPYDTSGRRQLVAHPLLAIDELGAEPLDQAGYGLSKIYAVLNGRVQSMRKTVLITNLSPEDFFARYRDNRLRDRIAAYGMAIITRGPSMRHGTGT